MCDSFVTAAFGSTVDWKSLGFIDSRVHPTDVVIQGMSENFVDGQGKWGVLSELRDCSC